MLVFDPGMLRHCRKRLRLRQVDVAREICKAPGCVGRQENGEMRVSADDLAVYAHLYGVNVDTFYKENLL